MPKRTNAFQAVVFMIKKHIAGDAAVTESAELIDLVSHERREVDVCIEAEIAGHTVVVSLECRDWKRPQAVGWVEEMHDKHSRLPTNRLVLVSSSGFTKGARAKAQSYGIETIVPDNLTEEQAGEIATRIARLVYTKLNLQTEAVRAWLDATDTEEAEIVLTFPNTPVFTDSREPISRLGGVVQSIQQQANFGETLFDAPSDIRRFAISAERPDAIVGNPPTPIGLYIEKIEPMPHLRYVKKIEIQGEAGIIRSDIPLRYGQLQETVYSWGTATFEGGTSTVVVATRGTDGTPIVSTRDL